MDGAWVKQYAYHVRKGRINVRVLCVHWHLCIFFWLSFLALFRDAIASMLHPERLHASLRYSQSINNAALSIIERRIDGLRISAVLFASTERIRMFFGDVDFPRWASPYCTSYGTCTPYVGTSDMLHRKDIRVFIYRIHSAQEAVQHSAAQRCSCHVGLIWCDAQGSARVSANRTAHLPHHWHFAATFYWTGQSCLLVLFCLTVCLTRCCSFPRRNQTSRKHQHFVPRKYSIIGILSWLTLEGGAVGVADLLLQKGGDGARRNGRMEPS